MWDRINGFGADGVLPLGPTHRQQLQENYIGFVFWIRGRQHWDTLFTWGDVLGVIESMRLYLVQGVRSY